MPGAWPFTSSPPPAPQPRPRFRVADVPAKPLLKAAYAGYQEAVAERHASRARAAALEAAITLTQYTPAEGDSAHGLRRLAERAESVLQGRQLGATQLRLALEVVRERQRASAERFRAAERAWEEAQALAARRIALELQPRHCAAVRALAAALAKSVIIALPAELTMAQNVELTRGFVTEHLVPQGVPVDWAIHCVPDCEGRPQPHAHIQFPRRELGADGWQHKLRHLDKKQFLRNTREVWARHANSALKRAGCRERVTHLSFKAQNVDLEPTINLGATASRMEGKGERSDRLAHNREVRARNAVRLERDRR